MTTQRVDDTAKQLKSMTKSMEIVVAMEVFSSAVVEVLVVVCSLQASCFDVLVAKEVSEPGQEWQL